MIVCEGTDTEYLYFSDMRNYIMEQYPNLYCDIKVVPSPEEIIRHKNPSRTHKGRRLVNAPMYHYYSKYETNASDYEKYRAQPTRYVREAALFMKEDGYQEGWAVFDNDKHPAHEFAFKYAEEDHVHIGFSSYSFEEWLLVHFERCARPFLHSECRVNDKFQKCGSQQALPDECHGNKCIAGYLRMKGYLPDYSKNKQHLFSETTLPRIQAAMANAAWMRKLSNEPIHLRNPYTDMDLMVASILQLPNKYIWCYTGQSFKFANSHLCTFYNNHVLTITNTGKTTVIITSAQMKMLLRNDTYLQPLTNNLTLPPDSSYQVEVQQGAEALLLTENYFNTFVFIP